MDIITRFKTLEQAREKGFVPISDADKTHVFVRKATQEFPSGKLKFELAVVVQS